jgi:nucleoside-diphosphate-sugar epimerase
MTRPRKSLPRLVYLDVVPVEASYRVRDSLADSSAIRKALGWRALADFATALAEYVTWVKNAFQQLAN